MKRKTIQNTVGISALVLLILLAGFIFLKGEQSVAETEQNKSSGSISFDEELVFDGSGKLNLMEGVTAEDSGGNDATDKVKAIITGDGTLNRKTVRYTLTDDTGSTVTKTRNLVMKNYDGPSLYVKEKFVINSQKMKNLINVLADEGYLRAEDGYGRDITSSVRAIREKKADGQYEMTFTVINSYQDSAEVTANVFIEGEISDPEIRLSENKITVRKDEQFDARRYIVYSSDGNSESVSGKIQIDSSVNTSVPGDYRVIYRLYSADKTAIATKVLKVKVEI